MNRLLARLRFFIARKRGDEDYLATFSVPQAEILEAFSGKRIALIGNARGLSGARFGAEIDAADIVIRINRGPTPSPLSHGTRTDMLALASNLKDGDMERLRPGRILWMAHKRKRQSWFIVHSPGFYLHPLSDNDALKAVIGSQPTTGLLVIDLLARSKAARIDLYGFDFFATLSLSGSRTAAEVPHDFPAEAAWVDALIARDPRFVLHRHG